MKRAQYLHVSVLAFILVGGLATFFLVQGDRMFQILTVLFTTAAYVAWGIIHHALERDLHPRIVIEYVLIGALAVAAAFAVIR